MLDKCVLCFVALRILLACRCAAKLGPAFCPQFHVIGVQAKTKELKASLNQDFRLIHELCLFVLNASKRPDLIRATLSALHAFLSW